MTAQHHMHFVHATALVVGEAGVLIDGRSRSGKSSLAAALLRHASARTIFGRLVGDDRVGLVTAHGRLMAHSHPAIAGLIERRGVGLLRVETEPACVIHLVVRLARGDEPLPPRLPDTPPLWSYRDVAVSLLHIVAPATIADAAGQVIEALAQVPKGASLQQLQSSC